MNIAIIGYGSIGQRHEKNCRSLGHNVDVSSLHEGRKLTRDNYDLVIICTKTSERLDDIKKNKHLSVNFLIEKPLAATYAEAIKIKKELVGKNVRVGYCLIFNPVVNQVKKILDIKMLGNIFFSQIYAGSYLPNWRKRDYRKSYSANKDAGGGVEFDLIHEINYAQYLFPGNNTVVYSYLDKVSDLAITSHDLAFFVLRRDGGYINITLNYFQQFAERYIKIYGIKGTLLASIIDKQVEVYDDKNKKVYGHKFDFEYNQMYMDEIKSMEQCILDKGNQMKILSLDQAILDLRIVGGKT